jgi:hypothetical protein
VADCAIELYVSSCVLNRLDAMLGHNHTPSADLKLALETGRYYLLTADRRIRKNLADLWSNDDEATTSLADKFVAARRP